MKHEQYVALKAELVLPAYNGMTVDQKVAALNDNSTTRYQKVQYRDVASYLMVVGKYLVLSDAVDNDAREFMLAMNTFNNFDMTNPVVETKINASLDALITAGHLVAGDKAAILSLADEPINRLQELNDVAGATQLPTTVHRGHVTNAENYNG